MNFLFAVEEAASSPWWWDVLGILSIPLLVAANGFFVAAEFALVKIRRTRVEELVAQGETRAKAIESAIANLDRSIAATQLGITLASLALGWLGETSLEHLVRPLFASSPPPFDFLASHSVAAGVAFSLITFMHVVFGELVPKTIALQTTERTSLLVAAPLNFFTVITRPLILLMNGTGNVVLRLFGYRVNVSEGGAVHSVDELSLIIEDVEEAGIIDPDQADLLLNIFAMTNKTVRDCMVPKEKMMALELRTPPEKVMEIVRQGAHTRLPVYDGELDNIVGIVNTKDLFYIFSLRGIVLLEDAIYPAIFLHPDEEVANALRLFKKSHKHMALVRDENEKILGLVTLEDVLEEIVGEIQDEHDLPRVRTAAWRRREFPSAARAILPKPKETRKDK